MITKDEIINNMQKKVFPLVHVVLKLFGIEVTKQKYMGFSSSTLYPYNSMCKELTQQMLVVYHLLRDMHSQKDFFGSSLLNLIDHISIVEGIYITTKNLDSLQDFENELDNVIKRIELAKKNINMKAIESYDFFFKIEQIIGALSEILNSLRIQFSSDSLAKTNLKVNIFPPYLTEPKPFGFAENFDAHSNPALASVLVNEASRENQVDSHLKILLRQKSIDEMQSSMPNYNLISRFTNFFDSCNIRIPINIGSTFLRNFLHACCQIFIKIGKEILSTAECKYDEKEIIEYLRNIENLTMQLNESISKLENEDYTSFVKWYNQALSVLDTLRQSSSCPSLIIATLNKGMIELESAQTNYINSIEISNRNLTDSAAQSRRYNRENERNIIVNGFFQLLFLRSLRSQGSLSILRETVPLPQIITDPARMIEAPPIEEQLSISPSSP